MSKRILLIGGLSTDSQDIESLQEFSAYLHATIPESTLVSTHIDQIEYYISSSEMTFRDYVSGKSLEDFDQIIIRGPKMRILSEFAFYVSYICNLTNKPLFNDYSLYYPGTKVAQALVFAEHGALFPATLFSTQISKLIESAEAVFSYPYILKTNVGSHGDSNYLVKDKAQALEILNNEPQTKFLAQQYCPNDRDYRLLLVGNSHMVFERKGDSETHLNNTSKGAEASLATEALPEAVIKKAFEISKALKFTISGVDVMPNIDTGELYFLEINTQPQLRTGAFLNEKQQLLRELLK